MSSNERKIQIELHGAKCNGRAQALDQIANWFCLQNPPIYNTAWPSGVCNVGIDIDLKWSFAYYICSNSMQSEVWLGCLYNSCIYQYQILLPHL